MNPAKILNAIRRIADLILNPPAVFDAVDQLIDVVLDLVPHEVARQALDNAAVRRANAIADVAELAKFGPEKTP